MLKPSLSITVVGGRVKRVRPFRLERGAVMGMDEVVAAARDAFSARLVFAEPYTRDGTTVIAAAKVSGGGGGGGGHDREEGQEASGGGFGLHARPSGAYVMKNGSVRWMPAVDANRVITVIGTVVIAALLTRVRMEKLRAAVGAA